MIWVLYGYLAIAAVAFPILLFGMRSELPAFTGLWIVVPIASAAIQAIVWPWFPLRALMFRVRACIDIIRDR